MIYGHVFMYGSLPPEIKYLDKKVMEFSVGTQFSREFSFEETLIINDLNNTLNKCLKGKKYNSPIMKFYIGVICISKGFEPFFMARPLKILKKEPAIEYEIKLDFNVFFNADSNDRILILYNEFLNQSEEILKVKKMKDFNVDLFLSDLRECLKI